MAISMYKSKIEVLLDDFDHKYRQRTMAFLGNKFSLSNEDCEDVIQESYITLYQKAQDGQLTSMASSLYTYFVGICKNKAHEILRTNGKHISISIDNDICDTDCETLERNASRILDICETEENDNREQAIHHVVDTLPSPCGEILWSYYRDTLSMKTIAEMLGYSSENSVKVTKHRCQERFRKYYEQAFMKD